MSICGICVTRNVPQSLRSAIELGHRFRSIFVPAAAHAVTEASASRRTLAYKASVAADQTWSFGEESEVCVAGMAALATS